MSTFAPVDEQLTYLKKGSAEIIRESDLRAKLEKSRTAIMDKISESEGKLKQAGVDPEEAKGIYQQRKAGVLSEPFMEAYWSEEYGEIKYQIGEGCLTDQMLGQWHADICLGRA